MQIRMPKKWIIDPDIQTLHFSGEGQLFDSELLKVLRRINTVIGLCEIAKIANAMFWKVDESTRARSVLFRDGQILFSQWAMAYLSAGLIRSGGNDFRKRTFTRPPYIFDNIVILNNIHHNCLVQPELLPGSQMKTVEDLDSFLLRTAFEQFPYQLDPVSEMARSIYLFGQLSEKVQTSDIDNLKNLFAEITGLSMENYFDISFGIAVLTQEKPVFSPEALSQTPVITLQNALSPENLSKYLNFMSISYSEFRKEDLERNNDLPPEYTRYRFNPLCRRPIIISQKEKILLVPNASLFVRAAFPGLFWLFDSYFYQQGKIEEFRRYFSGVFELYVGEVLKDIYGSSVKRGGDVKDNYEFFDWYVEHESMYYLFEAKAYQYPFKIQTRALPEDVEKDVAKKIGDLIDQIGRKMRDVNLLPELKKFKGKDLYPVAVIWNMPLISTKRFADRISQMIEVTKKKYGLDNLSIHIMELRELENLISVGSPVALKEIFERADVEPNESIGSIIGNRFGYARNPMLQRIFKEFTDRISPTIADPSLR